MFDELLNTLRQKIDTTRAILRTNQMLREIAIAKIQESEDIAKLTELKEREWQIYEHCAAVTRLYAVYENFVEDLISRWLEFLPKYVPSYFKLDERIRNTHREGVGRLLLDLKKNRFKDLYESDVVKGLFSGVTGDREYYLIPKAFLLHEQNLRKDELERLFADAGIANAWKWVNNYMGSQKISETRLNELITYRNEAAHRAVVDEFFGFDKLLELCDFIEDLCQALADLVTYQIILKQVSTEQVREIGEITEWFDRPKAAVAKVRNIELSVGQRIFLASETKAYCQLAIIKSIQIDDVSQDRVEITTETEVGLTFKTDARKGLSLYVEVDKSEEQ